MKRKIDNIDDAIRQHLPSVSREDMETDLKHLFERLQAMSATSAEEVEPAENAAARGRGWRLAVVAASAAVFLAVVIGGIVWWQADPFAIVEVADGSVYRTVKGHGEVIPVGEKIDAGEGVRNNGGISAVLKLTDGSRVEMRSQSELSLERTDDGIRIRLNNGSLIVNAAKQTEGRRLYVETKDVTVSVVGTVFLVKAEEGGSLVAVIEGEVRLQQGATEKRLRQGEQAPSSPRIVPQPVKEEVGWSRHAEAFIALLEQPMPQSPPEREPGSLASTIVGNAFEEASVRLLRPSNLAGGRGDGALPAACMPVNPRYPNPTVDPRRFSGAFNLFTWIIFAYTDHKCTTVSSFEGDLLSRVPEWVKSDQFRIEALIPAGNPAGREYVEGKSARLKEMMRTLLEDRFKLVLHRSQKEMQAFTVKVVEGGSKLTPARDSDIGICSPGVTPAPKQICFVSNGGPPNPRIFAGAKVSSAEIAEMLTARLLRPVLDRTGLTGEFTFHAEYVPREGDPGDEGRMFLKYDYSGVAGPSLFEAIEKQLGLKVDSTKAPIEVLTIQSVERPSEN
jgi:uncharacterized protein (TIGR03435 family)